AALNPPDLGPKPEESGSGLFSAHRLKGQINQNRTSGANLTKISMSDRSAHINVAILYLIVGIAGFTANTVVMYIKTKYKKHYSNITYVFMIQLAAADNFVLSANALCGSLLLFFPQLNFWPVQRIFGFFSLYGWYVGSLFLCFVAFSRYISITRNEKVAVYFSPKIKTILIIFPWALCFAYYSSFLWYPGVLLVKWEEDKVSWDFNSSESYFGYILGWQNVANSMTCIIVQIIFNCSTLYWLRKTRNTVLSVDQTKNRRRETKLFAQCFINCCLFAGAFLLFMSLNTALGGIDSLTLYLTMSLVWMMHHCANPVIYFMINKQLRIDFAETFFGKKNQVSSTMNKPTSVNVNAIT
uniref:G-protein coupled receptors family 1 profile domain-containing protein n=1 Tax=Romanomermis culicivorax TaxID=13658 RepID=A0A915L1K9_ROMCU